MRFRKGKKAFKSNHKSKWFYRYISYLEQRKRKRKQAVKFAMVGLTAAIGAFEVARIKSTVGKNPQEKTIALANVAINTAKSIAQILIGPHELSTT